MVKISDAITKLQVGKQSVNTKDINAAKSAMRKKLHVSEFPQVKLSMQNTYQFSPENPQSVKDILNKFNTFLNSKYCTEFAPWNKIFNQTRTLF